MQKEVYKRHIENFSQHWWFQSRKKKYLYSYSFLELENMIITLMKLIRKLKLKKFNRFQINLFKNLIKFCS